MPQDETYWNRFHIGLSKPAEASNDRPSPELSESPVWPCFELVPSTPRNADGPPSAPFEPMRHGVIGCDHELWQHIMPGDCVEISVKTRVMTSPKEDCEAVIRLYKTWQPSLEMLEFL